MSDASTTDSNGGTPVVSTPAVPVAPGTRPTPPVPTPGDEFGEIAAAARQLHDLEDVELPVAVTRLDELHNVLQSALTELDRS